MQLRATLIIANRVSDGECFFWPFDGIEPRRSRSGGAALFDSTYDAIELPTRISSRNL